MKYVETLFRQWQRFLILCVLLPAAIGGAVILLLPTYRATADIWVGDPSAYLGAGASPAGWSQYLTPAQNETDTINQMLKTRAFTTALDDRLTARSTFRNASERTNAINGVANLKVLAVGSHLVNFTYTCDRQDLCTQVLEAALVLFQDQLAQLQKDQATLGIGFLTVEQKDAATRVNKADDAVFKYLNAHPETRVDLTTKAVQGGATSVELSRLLDELNQARNHMNDLGVQLNQAQFIADASAQVVQTNAKIVDAPQLTKSGLIGDGTSLRIAAIAAAACLVLAAGFLFVTVRLDRTAREAKELEERLGLPVLSVVPHLSRRDSFAPLDAAV